MVVPTLIDYLYKKVLRPGIVGPAFVYNYPKTMQPLARQSDENPEILGTVAGADTLLVICKDAVVAEKLESEFH